MNLGGVQYPQSLIGALESGRLVIFAGAGVSMGEPSKLPSFWELALNLAQGTGESPKELGADENNKTIFEPLDQFLGRIPLNPTAMREKAASETDNGNPHNELHSSLLRVFDSAGKVRIVTTNYDMLFESAASDLWDSKPEIYSAPALPAGANFNGIVHIHGATARPFGIVLSDSDFGRAYLTEGWARRFLVDLFVNDNIVLFIGYSHDDTVLQYLARALPNRSEKSRFAMVDSSDNIDRWNLLGVEPIIFLKEEKHDYTGLYIATKELADYATRKPSQWKEKIGLVADNSPEMAGIEDEDLIRSALQSHSRTHFFTESAMDESWVPWLINEGAYKPLFEDKKPTKQTQILADWLLNTFISKSPNRVLQVLGSNQHSVAPWFWAMLAFRSKVLDDHHSFARFFDYLFQTKPWSAEIHAIQSLAEQCAHLNDIDRLIVAFEAMAGHSITLREPSSISNQVDYHIHHELSSSSPHWNINEVWNLIQPQLGTHAESVLVMCERLLLQRRSIQTGWSHSDDILDFDSYRRSAIEPHDQDAHPESLDVVINAARESVEHLCKSSTCFIEHWIQTREKSASFLVRRLALHAVGHVNKFSSDQKIELLLAKGIFDKDLRHESFVLLQNNFPHASDNLKARIVKEILSYKPKHEDLQDKHNAHEHYDWLSGLHQADPDCVMVNSELEKIHTLYPGFETSTHPDLLTWVDTSPRSQESPYSVTELLSRDNGAPTFSDLLGFPGDPIRDPEKSGLHSAIRNAATQNPEWGFEFIQHLEEEERWDDAVFSVLLQALKDWPKEKEQATPLLSLIGKKPVFSYHSREVADILLEVVRNGSLPYICEILPKTNEITLAVSRIIPPSSSTLDNGGLTTAINVTEGRLAEYWIHALSIDINQCDNHEFTEPYRSVLTSLVNPEDALSHNSIPVVTQQISFLYGVDKEWTEKHLKPLFQSNNDSLLTQAWDGFLHSSSVNKLYIFMLLKEAFKEIIPKIYTVFPDTMRKKLIEVLTAVTAWFVEQPNEAWIPHLITALDDDDRADFARHMARFLHHMTDKDTANKWDIWVFDYWTMRKSGTPVQLNQNEVSAMLNWLPWLSDNFPAAVDLAISIPCGELRSHSLVSDLGRSGLAVRYPNSMAKLISYILRCETDSHYLSNIQSDILEPLSEQGIDAEVRKELDEELISSGRTLLSGFCLELSDERT